MKKHSPQATVADPSVLEFINRVRREFGLRPAKKLKPGTRNDPHECPVARTIRGRSSLDVIVGTRETDVSNTGGAGQIFDNPPDVIAFIQAFDRKEVTV